MVVPVEVAYEGISAVKNIFLQPIFVQILTYAFRALPLVLAFWSKGDRVQDENEFQNPLKSNVYDFIIVGGGTAGGLAAYRLSKYHSVLLLEAGGDPNPMQLIPLFTQFLVNYPEVDYGYRSVPQRYASQIAVNQQTSISQGLGLGGSGTLNIMVHLRGHVKDYDNWGRITGDQNWGWSECLPFFKSYEDYEIPGDPENHGYNGPLRIETPDYTGPAQEFLAAGREMGYPTVDLNAPYREGFDTIRYPMRNGVRQATYKAFIEPIRTRLSFTLMKFAIVKKILMKPGNIAYGVEFDRHGETQVAYARKEVILTAGAFGTAKLLMLSGIGPRPHLGTMGIPVQENLPVGERLTDHLSVFLGPFFLNVPRSINIDRDITASEFVKWYTLGRGRLTSSTSNAAAAFASTFAKARGEGDWPDLELMLNCFSVNSEGISGIAHAFNFKVDVLRQYLDNAIGQDSCFLFVTGARPFSRGSMQLGGPGPYDLPIIDPNYLSDEGNTDLKVLIEGVNKAMSLMENTTSFGETLGVTFTNVKLPGCEHLPFRTDRYWECYVKGISVSTYHYSGTAAMGSVVDTKLRVLGTRNLRVLDSSVAPQQISTNIQASVLMIAEKGADMILRKWKGKQFNEDPKAVHHDQISGNIIEVDQDPIQVEEKPPEVLKQQETENIVTVDQNLDSIESMEKPQDLPSEPEKERERDPEPIVANGNEKPDEVHGEPETENEIPVDQGQVKLEEEFQDDFNAVGMGNRYANGQGHDVAMIDKPPEFFNGNIMAMNQALEKAVEKSRGIYMESDGLNANLANPVPEEVEKPQDVYNESDRLNDIRENPSEEEADKPRYVYSDSGRLNDIHANQVSEEVNATPQKQYKELDRGNIMAVNSNSIRARGKCRKIFRRVNKANKINVILHTKEGPPIVLNRKRKRRIRVQNNLNNRIDSPDISSSMSYVYSFY